MDENEKKVMLTVRMTKDELQRLKDYCWWERMTVSEFIRSIIPDQPMTNKSGSK